MKTQKIYIVDDHELFREGVKLMLEKFKHIEVIGESPTGEQFLEALAHAKPDIVLLDIDLPGISGETTCYRALALEPDIRIIAVSNHSDEKYYYQMLEAGARGYVAKQLSVGELLTAIEHVGNGEYYFSDKILKEILVRHSSNPTHPVSQMKPTDAVLSDNERQLLGYLAKGYTETEIANFMGTSMDTVDSQMEIIQQKTGAKDYIQLVMYSITNGNLDAVLN